MVCRYVLGLVAVVTARMIHVDAVDCSSCIDRSALSIRAIAHAVEGDRFWEQIKEGMLQTATDLGVSLEFGFYASLGEVQENMASDIRSIATMSAAEKPDALIVTIPNVSVRNAVEQIITGTGIPVFAFNSGSQHAREVETLAFAGQDELIAGETLGEFVRSQLQAHHAKDNYRGLWVGGQESHGALDNRRLGFKNALETSNFTLDAWVTSLTGEAAYNSLSESLGGCPYDVIQLATAQHLGDVVLAMEENGCSFASTVFSAFDTNENIYDALWDGQLTATVSQQTYLQGAFPLLLSALFLQTGQTLAPSLISNGVYLTGPHLITFFNNLLSRSLNSCETAGFKVCTSSLDETSFTVSDQVRCPCSDRSKIKIKAITHGTVSDAFWDPVYAAMDQAGRDYGIDLETVRINADNESTGVLEIMAEQISSFCDQDIAGVITSIPNEKLVAPIRECLRNGIPVVSINNGDPFVEDLGIQYVGQIEHRAGYDGGQRLLAAGAKQLMCVMHVQDNIGLIQRCEGMKQAITDSADANVSYLGMHFAPIDNQATYNEVIENVIGVDGDWDGYGVLAAGQPQIDLILDVQRNHPGLGVGSFDVSGELYAALDNEKVLFGISQNPYLQGYLPIPLLVWSDHTEQRMANPFLESGPNFVTSSPQAGELACTETHYQVCGGTDNENSVMKKSGSSMSKGAIIGIATGASLIAVLLMLYLYRQKRKW